MAAATALLVASCGDGRSVEPPLPESPVHEATFGDQGGEANREGPDSPAAEQVEDRAYPRTYVDDRLALQGKRSFKRLPGALPRSAFRSTASFKDGLAAAPRSWRVLGPVTPEVAPEASQFFDPSTGNVATTTQSGRVTAMAIDPNCGRPGRGCRLWVAAAGGGIWRTNDALSRQPRWIAPPGALPTNAFGSLIVDPNDPGGNTLYAGSGEPNGSGDSEAGLGLFRSTDGGRSWHLVRGSRKVAINRSIGSIAVEPGDPRTIYIGTDVARHGSSSVNGGRRTPPNAPGLGVYKSTDGGRHFALEKNLKGQTPPNPADPATGLDWFQGGVNKLQIDPGDPHTVYAAVFGYGLWRSKDGGHTWSQVFHTLYQNDFSDPVDTGDTVGDRTEFDLVEIRGHTRIYVGDSSDDLFVAEFWRVERAETKTASELIGKDDNAGWTKISDRHNGTNGFLSYNYCQNGQCGYDDFVVSPPGRPDTVWLGGSMAYDELPLYGGIPRSNGRAVIRSTNAGVKRAEVTFQDMTQDARPRATREGMHPDQHDIAFDPRNPDIAFVGSDGGVIRVHVTHPQDRSSACDSRTAVYDPDAGPEPLAPDDLADCRTLLRGIPSRLVSLNVGLNDIQFQSLSYNPKKPARDLLGGTQDNGTFSYSASPKWLETVGGDGLEPLRRRGVREGAVVLGPAQQVAGRLLRVVGQRLELDVVEADVQRHEATGDPAQKGPAVGEIVRHKRLRPCIRVVDGRSGIARARAILRVRHVDADDAAVGADEGDVRVARVERDVMLVRMHALAGGARPRVLRHVLKGHFGPFDTGVGGADDRTTVRAGNPAIER